MTCKIDGRSFVSDRSTAQAFKFNADRKNLFCFRSLLEDLPIFRCGETLITVLTRYRVPAPCTALLAKSPIFWAPGRYRDYWRAQYSLADTKFTTLALESKSMKAAESSGTQDPITL